MKSYISILILGLCSSNLTAQLEFKGKLGTGYNLKEVYLYKYVGNKAYPFDTIEVKNLAFAKNYKSFEKGLYLFGIGDNREEIVLTEDKIDIVIPNSLGEMPWQNTSKANADYFLIRKQIKAYDTKLQNLDESYRAFEYLAQTDPNAFNKKLDGLHSTLDSLNSSLDIFYANFSKTAQSEYGKKVAGFMGASGKTKSNYFNTTDLLDTQLASGDFISRKVNYYFMKFGTFNATNIPAESQILLAYTPQKNSSREAMYESIIYGALSANENDARTLQKQYLTEFGEGTKIGDRIALAVPPPAPQIGVQVPDIEAIDKDGNVFKLSDLRGKVVLIDFWASWCGPCRKESPNVVANYAKYKDQGFTILSISADKATDRQKWLQAIKDDNYSWQNHILSAEQGYKAQRDFQVKGYPTMFLIDKEGKLISTGAGLRGTGLGATLAQVFAQ